MMISEYFDCAVCRSSEDPRSASSDCMVCKDAECEECVDESGRCIPCI